MGLRQFPPTRQEPQEIRVMGFSNRPDRRDRESLRLSAGPKGVESGPGGSEPGEAELGVGCDSGQIRVDPDLDGGGGFRGGFGGGDTEDKGDDRGVGDRGVGE